MSDKTNAPDQPAAAQGDAEQAYDLKLEDAPPVERHDIVLPAQTSPLTDEELAALLLPSPSGENESASQARSAPSDDTDVPPPLSSGTEEGTSSSLYEEPQQTQPQTLSSGSAVSDRVPGARHR